ncbi:hypothetical protein EJ08DRAFT_692868 [Tothia fuscella]|uniref:Uncharacterized protein n=1 Tax=Tothia fuscella TaxID=1048955 RepID=A0A9P4U3I2_9PEZI|nr:hypothetical protein EJ08DRAFT_692868 [Tothia fuscella]
MAPTRPLPAHVNQTANPAVETNQPTSNTSQMSMSPQPNTTEDKPIGLRGGAGRGGMCPGRFCFIIPCPLPCDFCIC